MPHSMPTNGWQIRRFEREMDLFEAAKPFRRPPFAYAAAIFGSLAAFGIRLLLESELTGYPFLTFFPVVIIAAFLGGWGPGVVAALISGGLANAFLMSPVEVAAEETKFGGLGLVFFGLVSATMIFLVAELRRLNDRLESRVAQRTAELAEANAWLQSEIATREASEARIRQTQKMEALGRLTGGIAHDFNNMLAIVIGNLELARRRLERGEGDVGASLRNAMEGANRSAALTRRLLAFSRQQPLSPAVVNPNALVQGMAELLRFSIGERIRLECVLGAGIWFIRVDPGELENAIVNLAVNARDSIAADGELTIETINAPMNDPTVAARAEVAPGDYVVVAVSDTGAGMTAEVAARAFDPFFTTKEIGQGSGLGLAQVYGFVKQSGGHIKIYSEPDKGASIRLYLPRALASEAVVPADRRRRDEPMPLGAPDEVVLVVEDEDNVRRATVAGLRELGYTVRHAASGKAALAVLDEDPAIQLLFTDVVMPGMTGRELADIVAQKLPGLKVLYTTGYTRNAVVHNGVTDAGADLIMKPFALDQLARKIRGALDGGA